MAKLMTINAQSETNKLSNLNNYLKTKKIDIFI